MKILHASHISSYTPPKGYGGVELMVDTLAKEQIRRGHRVLVLGVKPRNAEVPYEFESVFEEPVKRPDVKHKVKYLWKLLLKSRDFDVIHIHFQPLALITSIIKWLRSKAVLLTLHADPSDLIARLGVPLVAISESQRRRLEKRGIKVVAVIYNGIDVTKYPFRLEKEDFFVYVGRIDETKGVHIAVQAAKRCNEKLVIIGPIASRSYFENFIKPLIDNENIVYLGEVDFETKVEYLSRAKALLYPVQYEEFFGIVMVEALATGTPVIGFAKGSVVEIVRDSVTGFLVKDVDEICQAMKRVDKLDGRECRKDVEEKFSSKIMAKYYEDLYQRLLNESV
uniref:Glycosyltransferase family 4 protein n=1 Tax=Ignisphaera aggregans TaxID=334771 RepID=A0A7C4BCC0_9CREN